MVPMLNDMYRAIPTHGELKLPWQNEKLSIHFGENLNDLSTYRSLIGSLLYIYATQPNIIFLVSLLSRFISYIHFIIAKRILMYLNGIIEFVVHLTQSNIVKKLVIFHLNSESNNSQGLSLDSKGVNLGLYFLFELYL
ncbi:Uncharacterized protein TCM_039647 [Theobroma cacao]|uniref:Mitochondrial protein n=1 Tax=Theobroma cacao TaxID=3641 RepID=A0A061GSJ8_THECC|nr:Uncharacterized protein TCM_039647 [Theobroma cacao]